MLKKVMFLTVAAVLASGMLVAVHAVDWSECDDEDDPEACAGCCEEKLQECLSQCPSCEGYCESRAGDCELDCSENMPVDWLSQVVAADSFTEGLETGSAGICEVTTAATIGPR